MKRNIERIINELQHDNKIQAMHRDNIAKRQALREKRRALMLARRNKHLPMAFDSMVPVKGNAEEWLHLRCVEAIRRIEAKGYDWVDYLFAGRDSLAMGVFEAFMEAHCEARGGVYGDKPRVEYADHTEVDGITVLHPNSWLDWIQLGQHWRDEVVEQEIREQHKDDAAGRAKAAAKEAKALYEAAMKAMAA